MFGRQQRALYYLSYGYIEISSLILILKHQTWYKDTSWGNDVSYTSIKFDLDLDLHQRKFAHAIFLIIQHLGKPYLVYMDTSRDSGVLHTKFSLPWSLMKFIWVLFPVLQHLGMKCHKN